MTVALDDFDFFMNLEITLVLWSEKQPYILLNLIIAVFKEKTLETLNTYSKKKKASREIRLLFFPIYPHFARFTKEKTPRRPLETTSALQKSKSAESGREKTTTGVRDFFFRLLIAFGSGGEAFVGSKRFVGVGPNFRITGR